LFGSQWRNLILHLVCVVRFPLFCFGIARSESQLKILVLATTNIHLMSGDFSLL
jgi:hypothetical protein